jgi:indolepyruvate ferredoxin oxidoreductase
VSEASADLLLALDLVVASDPVHLSRALPSRTASVASTSLVPTASMVRAGSAPPRVSELLERLGARTRPGRLVALDTVALSLSLFGDTVQANLIAVGAAWQAGLLPLAARSIERALELNGVAVERNVAAFRAGRLAVCDPQRLPRHERPGALRRRQDPADLATARALASERRVEGRAVERAAELVAYQDARLAGRYLDLVAAAHEAERPFGSSALGDAVADGFFHLLAYKDEYEVARLHLLPEFAEALARAVPAGEQLRYRLHPPFLRALGVRRKLAFPAWLAHPLFRALRGLRRLRGSAADPFGYASLRRLERRLAVQYEADLRGVLARLSRTTHAQAVELARLPLEIRGYEELKRAAIQRFESERAKLLQVFA